MQSVLCFLRQAMKGASQMCAHVGIVREISIARFLLGMGLVTRDRQQVTYTLMESIQKESR